MGCNEMKTDTAAFYWYIEGDYVACLLHVDVFLWGGTERFGNMVTAQIRNNFQIREQNNAIFRYIRLDIVQNEHDVTLHQKGNCKFLESISARGLNDNMECNVKGGGSFRNPVPQLGCLFTNSRPDLTYDVLGLCCK